MNDKNQKAHVTVRLVVDNSQTAEKALGLLAEILERPVEVVKGSLDFIHTPFQFAAIDLDDLTAGTGECRIALEPSDGFREFLLANGAGNI